ncbi:MAG TPA: replication-associated recombination protein A [Candidatus Dormibacteraeota bacterium]|nr:replication-associated recombination protein A [Candidatus Dormibacteraeota bacterium]
MEPSLFEESNAGKIPLAARMRPRSLDEMLGNDAIVGADSPLRAALARGVIPSLLLWGPPGSGKTTLARLIAASLDAHFEQLSAVNAGLAEVRRVVGEARERRCVGRSTLLFIDEIHRFNKAQQDALLPDVEEGNIFLIGATTENPSFELNAALLSRLRVIVLDPLDDGAMNAVLERALQDSERGLGAERIEIDAPARAVFVALAGGDARSALGGLEFAAQIAPLREGVRHIDIELARRAMLHRGAYDKRGDRHYDTISALIKSIRGSDANASVYWLARLLDAGEDPLFVARRLVILASEDVGLADAYALPLAMAAQQAVHFVGMPEGFYPLAHATLYLAMAPKSNAVGRAYGAALTDVQQSSQEPVPLHLRNAPTGLMRSLGYGRDYIYSHDDPEAAQEFLPERLRGKRYFELP